MTFLYEQIDMHAPSDTMLENDHALDAALCILACVDFLRNACIQPHARSLVEKEGWIWVRHPK